MSDAALIDTIKSALARQTGTLWQDALGVAALMVILVGALHLPSIT